MPKIVALVALACALAAVPSINPRRACHTGSGVALSLPWHATTAEVVASSEVAQ